MVDFSVKIRYMIHMLVSPKRSTSIRGGVLLGFRVTGVILIFSAWLPAIEIVPAASQDIIRALGPDADGLALHQESLPDLFTLTANRIEENPKQFIVQQPYTSGRWKGGKAVIEYARDLSYTLVSVYDKDGNRQRLYSVRTQFSEHVERMQSAASSPRSKKQEAEVASLPTPSRSLPSAAALSAPKRGESYSGVEWDEASGAYVPVKTAAPEPEVESLPDNVTAAAPKEKEVRPEVVAPAPTPKRSRRAHKIAAEHKRIVAEPEVDRDSGVWFPPKDKSSGLTGVKVKVADTTWVERSPKTPPNHQPRVLAKRRHKKHEPETVAVQAPAPAPATVVASSKVVEKASPEKQKIPPAAKTGDQWVPQDLLPPASRGSGTGTAETHAVPVPSVLASASAAKEAPASAAPKAPEPASARKTQPPVLERVPSTEELLAPEAEVPPAQAAPSPVVLSPISSGSGTETPPTHGASKKSGPDTSEGDTWVPKASPKPVVVEPIPEEPVKVAMIPKPVPVDNSVENLLKISSEGKSAQSHDSEAWVPQASKTPKPAVDIEREVARMRLQEHKLAAERRVTEVKRDINNPEEGVLPVSTFEKFSGTMYGRHREYERRFVAGKNRRAKVPDHDFYVDEVDRKKEIHNIYYYAHRKGKAPKLIAVERHSSVSFLGNYDIEKEDPGKISAYN